MMGKRRYDPDRHHRASIRKQGWDYTGPARYLVTVCSFDRETIFGDVVDGVVHLNEIGVIVERAWLGIAVANPQVTLDAYVVMPNHLHGIVIFDPDNWSQGSSDAVTRPAGAAAGSLGAMIGQFKRVAIRAVNDVPNVGTSTIWQRGYFDRIIPDDDAFERARTYIHNNPANWLRDPDHPRHATRPRPPHSPGSPRSPR